MTFPSCRRLPVDGVRIGYHLGDGARAEVGSYALAQLRGRPIGAGAAASLPETLAAALTACARLTDIRLSITRA